MSRASQRRQQNGAVVETTFERHVSLRRSHLHGQVRPIALSGRSRAVLRPSPRPLGDGGPARGGGPPGSGPEAHRRGGSYAGRPPLRAARRRRRRVRAAGPNERLYREGRIRGVGAVGACAGRGGRLGHGLELEAAARQTAQRLHHHASPTRAPVGRGHTWRAPPAPERHPRGSGWGAGPGRAVSVPRTRRCSLPSSPRRALASRGSRPGWRS